MTNIAHFEFNGFLISGNREDKLINLTEIWKAVGEPRYKDPRKWLSHDSSAEFIQTLAKQLSLSIYQNVLSEDIIKEIVRTKKGKGGGTWAHWQIALAYAKYLNPELHLAVNEWAKRFVEEEKDPELAVDRAVKNWKRQGKDEKWIATRLQGKVVRNQLTETLALHGCEGTDYANCTNAIYTPLLGGTAKQVKEQRGIQIHKNLRDNLSLKEIFAVGLAEVIASEDIEQGKLQGGERCQVACSAAGYKVQKAIY